MTPQHQRDVTASAWLFFTGLLLTLLVVVTFLLS